MFWLNYSCVLRQFLGKINYCWGFPMLFIQSYKTFFQCPNVQWGPRGWRFSLTNKLVWDPTWLTFFVHTQGRFGPAWVTFFAYKQGCLGPRVACGWYFWLTNKVLRGWVTLWLRHGRISGWRHWSCLSHKLDVGAAAALKVCLLDLIL